MANFSFKGFLNSLVEQPVEEETAYYEDEGEGYYEENDTYYDEYQPEETFVQEAAPAVTTPVATVKNPTVIMLTPYDIRTSQVVCDHIREGHIVICNLTNTEKNQRVVDYISGGVYALGGRVEPTPVKTTFVCTPKSVDLVVESADETAVGTKVSAL
ncbi:MAG: cell division protein SepF [Saccharofermentans sp.]|nr:cell division protein SepF [Saccharofermentans sp.]